MRVYMAPMEGITTSVYRRAFHECFGDFDKYFTPFLVPHLHKDFTTKEKREILPEYNVGMNVVPQILTNNAEDFVRTAKMLQEYGYAEVNLNLGCPSKTVVSKRRGAGFLSDPEVLERFLEDVFEKLDMKISIKTRVGVYEHDEIHELLEVYNHFPLEELIVHPRTQKEFYAGKPNFDTYEYVYKSSTNSLCYNGNICTCSDFIRFSERFPDTSTVMIGRGILANPLLLDELRQNGLESPCVNSDFVNFVDYNTIKKFHDCVYTGYLEAYNRDEKNVLFKMKEIWGYQINCFPNSEKISKKIKKASHLSIYEEVIAELFEQVIHD